QEPRASFEWLRRAHLERPDAESLERLDAAAERHSLFEELISVYEAVRARAADPAEQIAASLKIATICEDKLSDPQRAFQVLRDALPAEPSGRTLLPLLERIAERIRDWNGLLDVYARVARGRPDLNERVKLLKLRAEVREKRLSDPSGALDELVRSFTLLPEQTDTHEEILRLAGATGRWEDALKVEAQLFALAEDLPRKLSVARHAAGLVENEVKDLVRAFRAYLNAFRLAPDDAEIVGHLWRLAARIGRYDSAPALSSRGKDALHALDGEGDRKPEVDATTTDTPAATAADPNATIVDAAAYLDTGPAPEAVSAKTDAVEDDANTAPFGVEADAEEDATVDVDDASVIAIAVDTESSGALEELEVDDIDVADDYDDAPPPPPPVSRAAAPKLPPPTPSGRVPFGAAFDTPWEELAQAYDNLPAPDAATRQRFLLKETEVWERGQKDIGRALGVLERAFRVDPTDATVRAELERIGSEHDKWDQVCDIYLGAVDEFAPAEQTVSIHYEVARLREGLGQVDKAEQRYRSVINLKPDEKPALDRLEEITRSQGRSADLAQILERRTAGTAGPLSWQARRAKLAELADLYENALEKPYEAIDTLDLLVSGSLEDGATLDDEARAQTIAACESLARLYGRVGLWSKAIDSLQQQAELLTEPLAIRAVRLRVAEVYERELGQSARAIEAFEAVREADPGNLEALSALDRLYEAQGRWNDLQDTLSRRAALMRPEGSTEPFSDEYVDLIRRRARLLEERLGNPDEAAASLRALGPQVLGKAGLGSALVRNLRRAGLAHEAARTLTQQIEAARTQSAPPKEIVPVLLELSAVRGDDLNDPAGARQALDDALALAPDDLAALAALGRLDLKENDFAGYAAARRREARVQHDKAAAVAAFLDAGRVYRDQANAPEQAKACFEEAIARDPQSVEALKALGALHAAAGAWNEAREQLRRQLELSESPEARASVLLDLARSIWESSGDVSEAQKYVDQALELAPDHLPAVLAAADILYKDGQWAAAEKRLTEALRRVRNNPEQSARLHVRLAEVNDRLGRNDEAFRQLVEADRLTPGQLSIKLAMGENRFRAGKWREATIYLAPLVDHPDAALQADEVADGLAHAAQAEVKLRRPERALGFYESALALRANHPPSIRALAELALERGDKATARSYLERLVDGSGDRETRLAVLDRLGDLYHEAGETDRARQSYEAAIRLYDRPTQDLVGVMEKVLHMQRANGEVEAAAHTASALIELVQDPKERARRRHEAASLVVAQGGGGGAEALELLEAAFADNPEDDAILANICDVLAGQGKQKQAGKRLAEVLPTLPAPADNAAARQRRAGLWERLAEHRRKKDYAGAIAALEQALALDPQRISARTQLVSLYDKNTDFAEAAVANLRALVDADPLQLAGVKALGQVFAERGLIDGARCLFEVCDTLGPPDEFVQTFLLAHPVPELKPDDPYPGALDDEDRKLLAGPEARVMSDVFTQLWEGAPQLLHEKLEDAHVTAEDKISPMSDLDVAKIYVQVGKAIGNKKTTLYQRKDARLERMEIVVQTPPALVFGDELLSATAAEARFEIARALELTRPEYVVTAGVRPKQFTELFGNVLRAFHPRHVKRRAGDDAAAEAAAAFRKNVPYKVSKRLVELFTAMGGTSWSSVRWRKVVADAGNRAGLLLSGDLRATLLVLLRAEKTEPKLEASPSAAQLAVAVAKSEPLRELLRFAMSEDYFQLRQKLGLAASAPARPDAN
ncbi:MAG TPA: tetratricopeptide repeat protein, partial [Polyangia bacterium]|nr:tetratricopeptide repeat protein [Polyangia bacterium]